MEIEQFRKIYSDYRLAEARTKAAQYSSWDYSSQHSNIRQNPLKTEMMTRKEIFIEREKPIQIRSRLKVPVTSGLTSKMAGVDLLDTSMKYLTYGDLFNHDTIPTGLQDEIKKVMMPLNTELFIKNQEAVASGEQGSPGFFASLTIVNFLKATVNSFLGMRSSVLENDRKKFRESMNQLSTSSTNDVISSKKLPERAVGLLQLLSTTNLALIDTRLNNSDNIPNGVDNDIIEASTAEVPVDVNNDGVPDTVLPTMVAAAATNNANDLHKQNEINMMNSTKPQQALMPENQREADTIQPITASDFTEGKNVLSAFASALTSVPAPPPGADGVSPDGSVAPAAPGMASDKASWFDPLMARPTFPVKPAVGIPGLPATTGKVFDFTNPASRKSDAEKASENFAAWTALPSVPDPNSIIPPGPPSGPPGLSIPSGPPVPQSGPTSPTVPVTPTASPSNAVASTIDLNKLITGPWKDHGAYIISEINNPDIVPYFEDAAYASSDPSSLWYMKPAARKAFFGNLMLSDQQILKDIQNAELVFGKEKLDGRVKANKPFLSLTGSGGYKRRRSSVDLNETSNLHGRGFIPAILGDMTQSSEDMLKEHGNDVIYDMSILRDPLPKYMDEALDLVSGNEFSRLKKKYHFDQIFHLAVKINSSILIEKNAHGVNIANYKPYPAQEFVVVSRKFGNPTFTINSFLKNTETCLGDKFNTYAAFGNNCQNFIFNALQSNDLLTIDIANFVFQDMTELLKELKEVAPQALPIINTVTGVLGMKQKYDAYQKYNPNPTV